MTRVALAAAPTFADCVSKAVGFMLRAKGDRGDAILFAEAAGDERTVALLRRTAQVVGTMGDSTFGGPLADSATTAFFQSLRTDSIFFRLLADGLLRRVPLSKRLGSISAGASASIVGEGGSVPISRLTASGLTLTPRKAQAVIVVSQEVSQLETPAASSLVDGELRSGVSSAVDNSFVALVSVGAATFSSSGVSQDAMRLDLSTMIHAVTPGNGKGLVRLTCPNVAGEIGLYDPTGQTGPAGGRLLNLPLLVSDQIDEGDLILLNANGVAANADSIVLDSTRQSMIRIDDGDSPAEASALETSLWQSNMSAVRASVFFGAAPYLSGICAVMSGINYADSPDSPP